MKKANTKKNKTCFNIPEELDPFNLLHSFIIFNFVDGVIQNIGEGIGEISI